MAAVEYRSSRGSDLRTLSPRAQTIWVGFLTAPVETPPPEVAAQMLDALMGEIAEDVRLIRERGGEVVFARMPSGDQFREAEALGFPREAFWDRPPPETGAVGVHFEDHPELQGYRIPEWSHIHSDDIAGFTENFPGIVRDQLATASTPREELTP